MKTKLQIIENTFDNHFCKDPSLRAFDGSNCCYTTSSKTPKMCAVGMYFNRDKIKKEFKNPNRILYYYKRVGGLDTFIKECGKKEGLDFILKEEYKGHSVDFWYSLQSLHDKDLYWNKKELTEKGKECLKQLKEKYSQPIDS